MIEELGWRLPRQCPLKFEALRVGAQVSGFSAAKGRVVVKLEFDGELKMLEIKPQNLIAQSDA